MFSPPNEEQDELQQFRRYVNMHVTKPEPKMEKAEQDDLKQYREHQERFYLSPLPRSRVKDLSAAFEWLRGVACGDSLGIPGLQHDVNHAQVMMDEICRLNGVETNGNDAVSSGAPEHGRRVEACDAHDADPATANGVGRGVGCGQIGVE